MIVGLMNPSKALGRDILVERGAVVEIHPENWTNIVSQQTNCWASDAKFAYVLRSEEGATKVRQTRLSAQNNRDRVKCEGRDGNLKQ